VKRGGGGTKKKKNKLGLRTNDERRWNHEDVPLRVTRQRGGKKTRERDLKSGPKSFGT